MSVTVTGIDLSDRITTSDLESHKNHLMDTFSDIKEDNSFFDGDLDTYIHILKVLFELEEVINTIDSYTELIPEDAFEDYIREILDNEYSELMYAAESYDWPYGSFEFDIDNAVYEAKHDFASVEIDGAEFYYQ
jgi:hypothetical protein